MSEETKQPEESTEAPEEVTASEESSEAAAETDAASEGETSADEAAAEAEPQAAVDAPDEAPEEAPDGAPDQGEAVAAAPDEDPGEAEPAGEPVEEVAADEAPEDAPVAEDAPVEEAAPEEAATPTYEWDQLHEMTVAQLREVAEGIDHEAVQGYTQMHKDELTLALCTALGIEAHAHHEVVGIDKAAVKARIRSLQSQRDAALDAGDAKQLKLARRRIHRLKHQLRKATH